MKMINKLCLILYMSGVSIKLCVLFFTPFFYHIASSVENVFGGGFITFVKEQGFTYIILMDITFGSYKSHIDLVHHLLALIMNIHIWRSTSSW